MLSFTAVQAAEPASILYILSGAVGFLCIRRGKRTQPASTLMLFCKKSMHEKLQQLRLISDEPSS